MQQAYACDDIQHDAKDAWNFIPFRDDDGGTPTTTLGCGGGCMFDISKSLIRYWEGEFSSLKPHKNSR